MSRSYGTSGHNMPSSDVTLAPNAAQGDDRSPLLAQRSQRRLEPSQHRRSQTHKPSQQRLICSRISTAFLITTSVLVSILCVLIVSADVYTIVQRSVPAVTDDDDTLFDGAPVSLAYTCLLLATLSFVAAHEAVKCGTSRASVAFRNRIGLFFLSLCILCGVAWDALRLPPCGPTISDMLSKPARQFQRYGASIATLLLRVVALLYIWTPKQQHFNDGQARSRLFSSIALSAMLTFYSVIYIVAVIATPPSRRPPAFECNVSAWAVLLALVSCVGHIGALVVACSRLTWVWRTENDYDEIDEMLQSFSNTGTSAARGHKSQESLNRRYSATLSNGYSVPQTTASAAAKSSRSSPSQDGSSAAISGDMSTVRRILLGLDDSSDSGSEDEGAPPPPRQDRTVIRHGQSKPVKVEVQYDHASGQGESSFPTTIDAAGSFSATRRGSPAAKLNDRKRHKQHTTAGRQLPAQPGTRLRPKQPQRDAGNRDSTFENYAPLISRDGSESQRQSLYQVPDAMQSWLDAPQPEMLQEDLQNGYLGPSFADYEEISSQPAGEATGGETFVKH